MHEKKTHPLVADLNKEVLNRMVKLEDFFGCWVLDHLGYLGPRCFAIGAIEYKMACAIKVNHQLPRMF